MSYLTSMGTAFEIEKGFSEKFCLTDSGELLNYVVGVMYKRERD